MDELRDGLTREDNVFMQSFPHIQVDHFSDLAKLHLEMIIQSMQRMFNCP